MQVDLELLMHSILAGSVYLSLACGEPISTSFDTNQMFLMIHVICIGYDVFQKLSFTLSCHSWSFAS